MTTMLHTALVLSLLGSALGVLTLGWRGLFQTNCGVNGDPLVAAALACSAFGVIGSTTLLLL